MLRFQRDFVPREDVLRRAALNRGYEIAGGSLSISFQNGPPEWLFVAVAVGKNAGAPLSELAKELTVFEGVENFQLSHARN
jgi:putative Mg2+ transporter-C (MgtC) family protein